MSVPASISFSAHSILFHLQAECNGVHWSAVRALGFAWFSNKNYILCVTQMSRKMKTVFIQYLLQQSAHDYCKTLDVALCNRLCHGHQPSHYVLKPKI